MTLEEGIKLLKEIGPMGVVLFWMIFSFIPRSEARQDKREETLVKGIGEVRDGVLKVGAAVESLVKSVDQIDNKVDEVRRDNTNPRIPK